MLLIYSQISLIDTVLETVPPNCFCGSENFTRSSCEKSWSEDL